jgi:hypothetical protein
MIFRSEEGEPMIKLPKIVSKSGNILFYFFVLLILSACSDLENFKSQVSGSGAQNVVKSFVDSWVIHGAEGVMEQLDSRAPEATRAIVASVSLQSFDGDIKADGEGVLILETGKRIKTKKFKINPVVDHVINYAPAPFEISVAKDTGKVISIAMME